MTEEQLIHEVEDHHLIESNMERLEDVLILFDSLSQNKQREIRKEIEDSIASIQSYITAIEEKKEQVVLLEIRKKLNLMQKARD